MVDPKYLTSSGRIRQSAPPYIKLQYFIDSANIVHKNKYDYSKQVYTRAIDKLEIICREHGSFLQSPNNHVSKKQGCPKCAHPSYKKTTDQFVQEAGQLDYDYDYSEVSYIDKDTKVSIICKEHGRFLMRPDAHISQKQGCPKCQGKDFTMVYLLKCSSTGLVKIGITNNLQKRLNTIGGDFTTLGAFKVKNPLQTEKLLHKGYQQYRVFNSLVRSGGTEFFQLSQSQILDIKQYLLKGVICA